ncbi:MAG: hypothetical protein H7195_10005, partial [Chryseobacterium sp.]|nr:hypothetical protein [Chryseobacterium sp.]
MNTLFLTVSINAVETFTLPANIVSVEQTVVLVQALIQNRPKTIFIEIKHSQLNTLLELTDIAPYELWYFNEKKEFTGKSFSLQNGNASFQIQTQARFIALVPYGINYSVVSTSDTIHDSKKCSLSATYLEESAPFSIERAEWTL